MKTMLTLSAFFLVALSTAFSEVPAAVLEQLRGDLAGGMRMYNPDLREDGVAREWTQFEKRVNDTATELGKNFVFSEAELKDVTEGKSAPSDEELGKQVAELEQLVPATRFPKMLGYYEKLRSDKKLSPQQRIIHSRTLRAVIADVKNMAQQEKAKQ